MGLPVVYHTDYVTPLPPEHRFPMPKFGVVYDLIHSNGLADNVDFYEPDVPSDDLITLVHTDEYYDALMEGTLDKKALKKIGLPWSHELMLRTRTAVGGTILTAELALNHGLACNTAGGTHHAFPDHGSGFCLLNDLAIAAQVIREKGAATNILIIDLDVHQGDGTAAAFANDDAVFTFSMHCEANFPFVKQRGNLDIGLEKGMRDEEYLSILGKYLPDLLNTVSPDLVLYDAGVDPHVEDRLGKLNLSDAGIRKRDHTVIRECVRNEIPIACVIGGGYDEVYRLSERHFILHHVASKLYFELLN